MALGCHQTLQMEKQEQHDINAVVGWWRWDMPVGLMLLIRHLPLTPATPLTNGFFCVR